MIANIRKAHIELYECMKLKHEKSEQFNRDNLMEIYNNFVVPSKRVDDSERLTDDQIYNNASVWLNRAISVLVRRGYFGLTFRENVKQEDILCLT